MANLGDLQSLVLTWLDDPNAGYFTLPVVTTWLNNAQREVVKLLERAGENYYLICKQTQTVINQPIYMLPSDFRKLNRLEIVLDGTPPRERKSIIAPITLNQQDYTSAQTGNPESYVLRKNSFRLYPVPDSLWTLRLHYSYKPVDMVLTTDAPDVPDDYHEFIAVLATLDGAIKDKTDMTGIMAKRDFYMTMLKQDADQRRLDQPRTIVVTEDDGFGRIF